MMFPILLGSVAFALMLCFDLVELFFKKSLFSLFAGGLLLLLTATGLLIFRSDPRMLWETAPVRCSFFALLALGCGYGLYVALFAALPKQTYQTSEEKPCISSGLYGICRHPGALLLFGFYGFLALALPSKETLYAFLVFPACNLIYVFIQDRFIFDKTIQGYGEYKKTVPFLIPTKTSLQSALRETDNT